MKKEISYERYFDKVYGCFLGKCIGGTAGAPAEGRKELMDRPLCEEMLHKMIPNDDLDLQIMWLELIERLGFAVTARDMADDFYRVVPYGPGEYAVFQKNYARGIMPPVSGRFNNRYYKNGMGCPIRSEIWACLFPGDAPSACRYAKMDGSLDHGEDSVDGELFLAALESTLFFTDDLRHAIGTALSYIRGGTKLDRVLRDTLSWYDGGLDWKMTRGLILRHYGHADCTNVYQNLGFILLSLLYGGGDFRETVRLGLACGYDTDCICATAGAVLGLMRGGAKMLEDGMTDTGYEVMIGTARREGTVRDLVRDISVAGVTAAETGVGSVAVTGCPETRRVPTERKLPPFALEAHYDGDPVLSPDEPTTMRLAVTSRLGDAAEITVRVTPPEGVCFAPTDSVLTLRAGETAVIEGRAWVDPTAELLSQKNIFRVRMATDGLVAEDIFGLAGCEIWFRYGPYLACNRDLSDLPPEEKYAPHLTLAPGEDAMDVLREYHLSGIADIDRAFVPEDEPFTDIRPDGTAASLPQRLAVREDLFDLAEVQAYEGPHVDYLVRRLWSPKRREVELIVGQSAPFALWINGREVGRDRETKWWTAENRHYTLTLEEGENRMVFKCAAPSGHALYSFGFRIVGGDWRQYADMGSYLSLDKTDNGAPTPDGGH